MVAKNFQTCSYRDNDVTNYIIFFFLKLCEKWLKYVFFLKLTLWQLEKRKKIFQDLLSVFESQDNIQSEYIKVNMLMFLKSPLKRC